MSTWDALGVHVGTRTALEAVGVRLQIDVVLLILLIYQVSQVILIIDDLEDLPVLGEDEVGAVIAANWLRRFLASPAFGVGAGVGGGV